MVAHLFLPLNKLFNQLEMYSYCKISGKFLKLYSQKPSVSKVEIIKIILQNTS